MTKKREEKKQKQIEDINGLLRKQIQPPDTSEPMRSHSQRCETCQRLTCYYHPQRLEEPINPFVETAPTIHVFTSQWGCASFIGSIPARSQEKDCKYYGLHNPHGECNMCGYVPCRVNYLPNGFLEQHDFTLRKNEREQVISYRLDNYDLTLNETYSDYELRMNEIHLDRTDFKGEKWAIRTPGFVVNKVTKSLTFAEPSPSNRDDKFLKDHRFDSVDEALTFWKKYGEWLCNERYTEYRKTHKKPV